MTTLSPWLVGMVETRRSIGFFCDLHLDAAVLRQAFLRDAHRAGHDLEPADDGGLQTFRRRLHFLEHAVDAEADAEFFVERLEMNVAGARAMGFDQQHRNHADDRRVRFVGRASASPSSRSRDRDRHLRRSFPEDVGGFIGRAVIFDQRFANFFRAGADQLELALQAENSGCRSCRYRADR